MHKKVAKEDMNNVREDKVKNQRRIKRKQKPKNFMGLSQSMNQIEELKDQVGSLILQKNRVNDGQKEPSKILQNEEL